MTSKNWLSGAGYWTGIILVVGIIAGCGDDTIAPEYEFGIAPLADTIHWQSTAVIWAERASEKTASMLIVGADWCGWCRKLEDETLRDRSVMGLLDKYFHACIIDGDSDSLITVDGSEMSCRTATRTVLNVTGYPTVIFYDNDGRFLAKQGGFKPPQQFADMLWRIAEQARGQ